ncbi:amino acid deaminase [Sphingomonas oligophenolica]|uniref:Alanine racemase n=1 Tax=Sphingomonas oligophenolica TaxID=301154 RepID=A0ABU9Y8R9_9SPHN
MTSLGDANAAQRDADAILSPLDKGVPLGIAPMPIAAVSAQQWNILRGDLPLPAALIREESLQHNARWMRSFIEANGVQIAPHGKTTMAPALFDLQLAAGAWGITLATPHQVAAAIALGYRRIFIANQIIGRAALRYLFDSIAADDELELYCLVDSIDLVEQIDRIGDDAGATKRLAVLVEKGFAGGRTGCRSVADATAVARRVAASRHQMLAGVEGFEGIVRGENLETTLQAVRVLLDEVVEVAEHCDREGLFGVGPAMLSAGGSAFFDLVVSAFKRAKLAVPPTILLRSGCYITHDAGMYAFAMRFLRDRAPELFEQGGPRAALEVWGYVQARPEPNLAIVALGKRDLSYDQLPVLQHWFRPDSDMSVPGALSDRHKVGHLDDQHCYVSVPADTPLIVGDMVGLGISHPCLTFDKWRVIHTVSERYDVTGSIRTYF